MSTKTEKSKPKEVVVVEQPPAPKTALFSLLFQLEDMAVDGRRALFEAVKKILSEQKIVFTPALFSRYCLGVPPAVFAQPLIDALGVKKITAEKMVEEIESRVIESLTSGVKLDARLSKILHAAAEREVSMGAIGFLPEEPAQGLMAKLGLTDLGVKWLPVKDPDPLRTFPGANAWLRAAKAMGQKPHHCGVLAASMIACKSALSADMLCVAVPDEMTAFQDYGGAIMILDSLDQVSPKELLDCLFPAPAGK